MSLRIWAVGVWLTVFASAMPLGCGGDDGKARGLGGQGGENHDSSGPAGSGGVAGEEGGEGDEYDAFDAFRSMQEALRASPDHWMGRAEELVRAKDAEGLFALVKDHIAAIPGPAGFEGAGTARRFGARATLRGGMGTLRERADLLRDLLLDAGFDADVYVGRPEVDFDIEELLAHPPRRLFAPKFPASEQQRWRSVLPEIPEDYAVSAIDDDNTRVDSVLDILNGAGVSSSEASALDFEVTELPFVRATIDGETVDLNPNVVDAPWGETRALQPEFAPAASPLQSVTVRLGVTRSSAPEEELPLVERTWTAEELVGRTVTAAFATEYGFLAAAQTGADRVQSFIPTLQVRGADLTDAEAQALSASGAPITRGGEPMAFENDSLLLGDERAAQPPSDASLLARVEEVSLDVDEAAFPEVSVLVSLRDGDGDLVTGLAADAFLIEEDGKEVAAVLRRSELPPPKVALLFDRSTSLPAEFLDEAAVAGHDIAAALLESSPGVSVQIVGMDIGRPSVAGGFVTSLEDVDAQLAELAGAASEVWTNLGALAGSEATLVVMISDFEAEDEPTAEIERALAAGPPVLAVKVGTANTEAADRIAELTSGTTFEGVSASTVATAAAQFVRDAAAYTYRLVFRAAEQGADERSLRVLVDSRRLEQTDTYSVPDNPAPPPAISGVIVTIATAGRELRRVVAGSARFPTEEEIEEADAMLFGRAVLGVEAGPPSLSEKLDEHIGERLRLEPVVDAVALLEPEGLLRALASSRTRTPANLRFAFSASPDELRGPATYPDGVSTVLYVERPIWGKGTRRSLDLLALAPRRTAARDPEEAFELTLRRTAYLAAFEAARFPTSTLSLLEEAAREGDTPFGVYNTIDIFTQLGDVWDSPVQSYAGRDIVAPTSGTPLAFFAVDPATGDVIGSLPDGTGGAIADEVDATLSQIETLLSLAERAGDMGGFNGIHVWTELERTKANLVGAATILIGEGTEPDMEGIVQDAIAGAIEDGIAGQIPGLEDLENQWNDFGQPITDLGDLYDGIEAFTGQEMPDVAWPPLFP